MMSRLDALESLLKSIQAQSPEGAQRLLELIRGTDDPVSLYRSIDDLGEPSPFTTSTNDYPPLRKTTSDDSSSTTASPRYDPELGRAQLSNAGSSSMSTVSHLRTEMEVSSVTMDSHMMSDQHARPPNFAGQALPEEEKVSNAIDAFCSSSSRFFQLYTQDQVSRYRDIWYCGSELAGHGTEESVAVSCVASVAAIGGMCVEGIMGSEAIVNLYELARHRFEHVVEQDPLNALKLCTFMCMYNVMGKATVALAYVGTCWPGTIFKPVPMLCLEKYLEANGVNLYRNRTGFITAAGCFYAEAS